MLVGRSLIAAASAVLTALMALGFVDPWVILGVSFVMDGRRPHRSRLAGVNWRHRR
ncbi:hypothetical protein [Mesorhizobium sp. M0676]|uniref:hypothetical protein n=1 Tax=Mesorhizobium sp. M0676 TaxID=2956984 RepID=UPI00333DFBAA